MSTIELPVTEIDDPRFVIVVDAFLSHYVDTCHFPFVKVVQIDNWFGQRWLGFAGKFHGLAGIRNRSLHTTLPSPPFRPTRVCSVYDFTIDRDGSYNRTAGNANGIHAEKSGEAVWNLTRPGLYCWYSGNTIFNTTASLMIYEVTREGNNAWYISFDRRDDWEYTSSSNVSAEECIGILRSYRGQS